MAFFKFKLMEWAKFGAVIGVIASLIIAVLIYFGASFLYVAWGSESLSILVGAGIITWLIVAITFAVCFAIVIIIGRLIYQLFNLKIRKPLWKVFLVLFLPTAIIRALSFNLLGIIAIAIGSIIWAWLGIKAYEMLRWRVPQ